MARFSRTRSLPYDCDIFARVCANEAKADVKHLCIGGTDRLWMSPRESGTALMAEVAHQAKNSLVGEVPVQEYGDKQDDDLCERFKLKKDDFLSIGHFLFDKDNKDDTVGRMTPKSKGGNLATELRSTTVGTPPEAGGDDDMELEVALWTPEVLAGDEEEVGAKEEAEFSLDGRLATIKRWRGFQALSKERGDSAITAEPHVEAKGEANTNGRSWWNVFDDILSLCHGGTEVSREHELVVSL